MMTPTPVMKNYAYRTAGGEMFVVFIFKSIKFWVYSATCFIKSHSWLQVDT